MNNTIIMLVQLEHLPIPPEVEILHNFGHECVRNAVNGALCEGEAMCLRAEDSVFQNWLRDFPGVWMSNNPGAGQWKVYHVLK